MPPNARGANQQWRSLVIAITLAVAAINCSGVRRGVTTERHDGFETMRSYIHAWLSDVTHDMPIMASRSVKETIVDDWTRQSGKYEIVDVRNPEDFRLAGHVPHATNVYWVDILAEENLARLRSGKTLLLYCYYGHGSMLTYTILSLIGYPCRSLDFGMMDWNLTALVKDPWDRKADYEVETTSRQMGEEYPFPAVPNDGTDPKAMIKDAAKRYFEEEGSPVVRSQDVKGIVDRWPEERDRYQIVDVRSGSDYKKGHIPNAVSIPLKELTQRRNLSRLNPGKTVIVCSENGQTGQMASTVLNLLGYRAVNLLFGMMDWNSACVRGTDQWDGAAGYTVEHGSGL